MNIQELKAHIEAYALEVDETVITRFPHAAFLRWLEEKLTPPAALEPVAPTE